MAPPNGSRPDLSVDGVLHVGRPTIAQQNSPGTVFKLVEGGSHAERVQVQFGRTSVSRVEIVGGLNPGDIIIMSDMSQWDNVDRVRIK